MKRAPSTAPCSRSLESINGLCTRRHLRSWGPPGGHILAPIRVGFDENCEFAWDGTCFVEDFQCGLRAATLILLKPVSHVFRRLHHAQDPWNQSVVFALDGHLRSGGTSWAPIRVGFDENCEFAWDGTCFVEDFQCGLRACLTHSDEAAFSDGTGPQPRNHSHVHQHHVYMSRRTGQTSQLLSSSPPSPPWSLILCTCFHFSQVVSSISSRVLSSTSST